MTKQNEFNKAITSNDIKKVKLLLNDPRVDPSNDNNLPLCLAVKKNHIDIVKLLLKNDRFVSLISETNDPISIASQHGYIEILELLLKDKRIDPSDYENFAVAIASENGHINVVQLLLNDKRVDPSDYKNHSVGTKSPFGNNGVKASAFIPKPYCSEKDISPSNAINEFISK